MRIVHRMYNRVHKVLTQILPVQISSHSAQPLFILSGMPIPAY